MTSQQIEVGLFVEDDTKLMQAVAYGEVYEGDNRSLVAWVYTGGKNNDETFVVINFNDEGPERGILAESIDLQKSVLNDGSTLRFN